MNSGIDYEHSVSSAIPGPPGVPVLGSIGPYARDRVQFIEEVMRTYGDVCRVRFPLRDTVLLGHPDYAAQVLNDRSGNFSKFGAYGTRVQNIVGGLPFIEGVRFTERRRAIVPMFAKQELEVVFRKNVRSYTASLPRALSWATDEDGVTDLQDAFRWLIIGAILNEIFSDEVTERELRATRDGLIAMGRIFGVVLKMCAPPNPLWGADRIRSTSVPRLFLMLQRKVARRRRDPGDRDDVLARMLAVRLPSGAGMSDWDIATQVLTVMEGSFEPVSAALTQTVARVLANPVVAERLTDEAAQQATDDPPTAEVRSARWAKACFEEAMRLQSTPILQRFARSGFVVGGYEIPDRTLLGIPMSYIHRDPRWWHDPDTYDPARFYDGLPRDVPRLIYLPFGSGPHRCLGAQLGYLQAQFLLSLLFQRYHMVLPPGWVFRERTSIAPYLRGGLPVRLTPR
ncbi:cytochrome P450 [Nocardia transvalensis]|uniref:cytochrome P450 n=1 Tax=Nocardia transvalensis TaxID=37333 RepID=UPI001892DFF0|nr:cytochrome P450 [Nocardia transvalensis]MBF6333040.1 cytochrome P450 [Nocardia transvalensis]